MESLMAVIFFSASAPAFLPCAASWETPFASSLDCVVSSTISLAESSIPSTVDDESSSKSDASSMSVFMVAIFWVASSIFSKESETSVSTSPEALLINCPTFASAVTSTIYSSPPFTFPLASFMAILVTLTGISLPRIWAVVCSVIV